MDVYQRRRLVALSTVVGVFVIVVLAVASGGDDGDDASPVTGVTGATGVTGQQGDQPIAKQQYIDQADAICEEANSSLAAIDQTDAVQAAQRESQVTSNLLQELRALPAPDRGANVVQQFLQALNDEVDALRNRQIAVERGDSDALIQFDGEVANAQAEAQAAAEQFGFEACGNPAAVGDTGEEVAPEGTVEPAPVEPAPVEPAPTEPPPEEPPPDDGGDTGGVSPEEGSGGVSP